jgi:hypothetical protein
MSIKNSVFILFTFLVIINVKAMDNIDHINVFYIGRIGNIRSSLPITSSVSSAKIDLKEKIIIPSFALKFFSTSETDSKKLEDSTLLKDLAVPDPKDKKRDIIYLFYELGLPELSIKK